ncbi:MAG: GntR family transcriptional regulator [Clostridia bacterium]
MSMKTFESRQPLYLEVANELKKRIVDGVYPMGTKLASEPDLAKEFGVSRGTLREALSILEKNGDILRKHGLGSFVERRTVVTAGIEKLESLTSTIERSGYQAEDRVLNTYVVKADESIAENLQIPLDTECYVIESLRLADGFPIIYCYDVLPAEIVGSKKELEKRCTVDCITEFLKMHVGRTPVEYISKVRAVQAEKPIDMILNVSRNTPLILMEGVVYDIEGKPINYGKQYFNSDRYQFTLVRR